MDRSSQSMSAGIQAEHLRRSFGHIHAVVSASLSVPPGSVTALIGPNGSGKTTLLLMLATLLKPDSGQILIGGHDAALDPASVRATIGWMPDALGSWPALSVRETLQITGRMYRLTRTESASRADELIKRVGLTNLAAQPTRVLSRGQKQKLSLARALIHRPRVLLLDEPASGLDPGARVDLRQIVSQLAAEGTAILISSHVLSELDEMVDSAVFLTAGTTASEEAVTRAGASRRDWRIRSLNPEALQHALADDQVAGVHVDNLGTIVSVSGEAEAATLLTRLTGRGVPVTFFAPAVGDLEHTFLDLNPSPAAQRPEGVS